MHRSFTILAPSRSKLCATLLCVFAGVLWLAGGASRADVLGQSIVRFTAAAILITAILFRPRLKLGEVWQIAVLLTAATAIVLLQLVPLPPVVWQALPGREPFVQAIALSGSGQPWRPLAMVPSGAINAVAALIVPATILVLLAGLTPRERARTADILLYLIVAATVVGLAQLSGAALDNPFINESLGDVCGTFANRNHFVLFLAIGCLLAPQWALASRVPRWRVPVAIGLVLLFVLTILATGSRAGLLLGGVALAIALMAAQGNIRQLLARYPQWLVYALPMGVMVLVGVAVAVSLSNDRALSIHRVLTSDMATDMRSRGLPTVIGMIQTYFPAGSGFGSFDPVFRMHEPMALLKPTYFNHAHNDWLEIVLDGGAAGALLVAIALLWWAWLSIRAWWPASRSADPLPRLGSALLLLVFVASLFDYPARTPIIMAVVVVAAFWLAGAAGKPVPPSALPISDHSI